MCLYPALMVKYHVVLKLFLKILSITLSSVVFHWIVLYTFNLLGYNHHKLNCFTLYYTILAKQYSIITHGWWWWTVFWVLRHITPICLYWTLIYQVKQKQTYNIPRFTVRLWTAIHCSKLVNSDQKSNHTVWWWWCGVVGWFILAIIEPPQSRLFNSGLYWVVANTLYIIT